MTTLIGSIFYRGHRIIHDPYGFDHKEAERLLSVQDEYADKTGIKCMVDVIGDSADSLVKRVEFVADHTDAAILLDGTTQKVRLGALHALSSLSGRLIYNSLSFNYTQEEVDAIRAHKLLGAVLLSNDLRSLKAEARIAFFAEHIPRLHDINLMFDTCVLDIPTLGIACETIRRLKPKQDRLGCGAHNAVGTWRALKLKYPKARLAASIATLTLSLACGAEWVLYGPIADAPQALPAALLAQIALRNITI